MTAGKFYCVECGHRSPDGGMCPRCPDEPLLNLAEEETWAYFDEQYGRAKVKRYGQAVAACLPVGLILLGAMAFVGIGFIISIPVSAAATGGLASGLAKMFPPKPLAPQLAPQEIQALRQA